MADLTIMQGRSLRAALRKRRKELGMTLERLACRAGLEPYQVEYLESGEASQVEPEDLRYIGIALGGVVDELYTACGWNPAEMRTSVLLAALQRVRVSDRFCV